MPSGKGGAKVHPEKKAKSNPAKTTHQFSLEANFFAHTALDSKIKSKHVAKKKKSVRIPGVRVVLAEVF